MNPDLGSIGRLAESVLRRKVGTEAYELVCDPENEVAIYQEESRLNLWPKADEFGGSVKLIGCHPNVRGAVTGLTNKALAIEGGYDYRVVEGAGHLLQIKKPNECVRITLEFLGQCRGIDL